MLNHASAFDDFVTPFLKEELPFTIVQLKISTLQEECTDSLLAMIVRTFNESLKPYGKAFCFKNNDIMIGYPPKVKENIIQAAMFKAGMYLSLDASGMEKIQQRYIVPFDKENLKLELGRIENSKQVVFKKPIERKRVIQTTTYEDPDKDKDELTPALLARITKALRNTDLAAMIRNQRVCVVLEGIIPKKVYEEVYLSVQDMSRILPNVSLTKTPWLFMDLSTTLDEGVLKTVSRHREGAFMRDFALNLTVKGLLSDDFKTFDRGMRPDLKRTVVFELQPVEVFGDFVSYEKARNYVHDLGYKICLDKINFDTLPFVDREKLGIDFLKLEWNPNFPEQAIERPELIDMLKEIGMNRVILYGVDDIAALAFAHQYGISLLQGKHIQKLKTSIPFNYR